MTLNEEIVAFHYKIGTAITQWALVEFALDAIVGDRFSHKESELAIIGFRTIQGFRTKLNFVDEVLCASKPKNNQIALWGSLMKDAEAISQHRNRLAHNWVFIDPKCNAGRRAMLLPKRIKISRKQKYPGALCVRDIAGYELEFQSLFYALTNLRESLRGKKTQLPKHPERQPRLPTIAQIRQEIRDISSHPPIP